MKPFVWSVTGAVVFLLAMVSWSIAGKMMTTGGDMGVTKGILIMAGMVGLGGSFAVWVASRIVSSLKDPEVKCATCEGYGRVNKDGVTQMYGAGPFYECPKCKGTGKPPVVA